MQAFKKLSKNEREKIFQLFSEVNKLKFNEIEKSLKIRSNKVSYHLKKMKEEGLIKKEGDFYSLTKFAESYLPLMSYFNKKEIGPIPVVLVALMNKDNVLLIKRNKRPYKDYWALVGGKIHINEDFKQASLRNIENKTGIKAKEVSLNAILHERVQENKVIKHSFILFFTKVKTKEAISHESEYGNLKWFNINKLEKIKMIPSDKWLLKNKFKSNLNITEAIIKEKEGKLNSFKII